MATRNALTQKVCFDFADKPFVITEAVGSTWYLVYPYDDRTKGRLMPIKEIQANFTGFISEISYANAARNR